MQCYCKRDSVTRKIACYNHGATVILAPDTHLTHWLIEFLISVDPDKLPGAYQPRVVGAHPELERDFTVDSDGEARRERIPQLSEIYHQYKPLNMAIIKAVWKKRAAEHPNTEETPPLLPSIAINTSLQNLFIVTTPESFRHLVQDVLYEVLDGSQEGSSPNKECIYYGAWAHLIVDEAHMYKSTTCDQVCLLKELRSVPNPPVL